ncbi:MAG: hypothetical protein ACLTB5_00005, partial [Acutalibacteraceae bacterium]
MEGFRVGGRPRRPNFLRGYPPKFLAGQGGFAQLRGPNGAQSAKPIAAASKAQVRGALLLRNPLAGSRENLL